jgi:hypothetical protein
MVSLTWAGAAYARPHAASAALTAACKAEQKVLVVAEELNFAKRGSYVPVADLVSNRLLKRPPKLFVLAVNADGGVTISPTKQGGCPAALARTMRAPTTATSAAGTSSSASLVAACSELDRISREDAVGQPGYANVVADVLAFYERLKQVTQTQNPASPQIAQLDSIITQLRTLETSNPDQARAAAAGIATAARTSLKSTCGFS